MKSYYVMVDRPAVKIQGGRKLRHTNKPRREHKSFDVACKEAERLAKITKYKNRVLVLEVVHVIEEIKTELVEFK